MRSVTRLIEQVRRQTENEEVTDFTGISDKEFIQYLNDAQYNLQAAIVHQHPRVFIKEKVINAVSDQERYNLPSDCFLKNKVHNVEYSSTGAEDDYYVLKEDTLKSRSSGIAGSPGRYIRLAGQILLTPQPSGSGKIRINYVKRIRELTKAAGKLQAGAVTISTAGNGTLNLNSTDLTIETDLLEDAHYLCIVDRFGNPLVSDLEILDISGETLTYRKHTLSDEDVASVTLDQTQDGVFITAGPNSTTHTDLDISVERYLLSYAAWKILKRDSSVDSSEALQELTLMQEEIVKSYALISDDLLLIPELNSWDDWSY